VLCLCLDVPCLELRPIPPARERRFLLYNPAAHAQDVVLRSGEHQRSLRLSPRSAELVLAVEG
jgi:hypothetical protein